MSYRRHVLIQYMFEQDIARGTTIGNYTLFFSRGSSYCVSVTAIKWTSQPWLFHRHGKQLIYPKS